MAERGVDWVPDSSKRYRSEVEGPDFKVIVLTNQMHGLAQRVLVPESFASVRGTLVGLLQKEAAGTPDVGGPAEPEPYFHNRALLELQEEAENAFSRIWPKYVPTKPLVGLSYVTRGHILGVTYIVLKGATIIYNRNGSEYRVEGQTTIGWIGDGMTYSGIQAPISAAKLDTGVVARFEDFLIKAKISMGDFVEEMLEAVEYPVPGGIEQTFSEFGLPSIHARYSAFVHERTKIVLTMGTMRLEIDMQDTMRRPTVLRNHEPMPWMTEDVMRDERFWKTLAVRVLSKVPNMDVSRRIVSWRRMDGANDLTFRTVLGSVRADSGAFDDLDESVLPSLEY